MMVKGMLEENEEERQITLELIREITRKRSKEEKEEQRKTRLERIREANAKKRLQELVDKVDYRNREK
jgi:hypothetical protein